MLTCADTLSEHVWKSRQVKLCSEKEDLTSLTLTDEEDGEGDEEDKNMWDHIERIQETAVVQNPSIHVVGHRVILVSTECQGHGGTGTLPGTGGGGGGEDEGRTGDTDGEI